MKNIRLLLADDHTLVRAGMRALLKGIPDIDIVAEAENGFDALRLINETKPDIALLDIAMPGMNGLEVAFRAAKSCPTARIIILSMHANEEYVLQAMRSGAAGYLLKGSETVELEMAVKAVARGESYLSPAISRHVIEGYLQRVSPQADQFGQPLSAQERLTPRQREILKLIAEGYTTKEIAQKLGIGVKTVETHRTQLMKELGIHEVAGLVRYALRIGLTSLDE